MMNWLCSNGVASVLVGILILYLWAERKFNFKCMLPEFVTLGTLFLFVGIVVSWITYGICAFYGATLETWLWINLGGIIVSLTAFWLIYKLKVFGDGYDALIPLAVSIILAIVSIISTIAYAVARWS